MDCTLDESEMDLLNGVRNDALEDAAALIENLDGDHFKSAARLIRALKHVPSAPSRQTQEVQA